MSSETVHYKRGVSQQFSMPSFKIDFSEWKEEDVSTLFLDHSNCTNFGLYVKISLPTVSHSKVNISVSTQYFAYYTFR